VPTERITKGISGKSPTVKNIWFVSASTLPDATFETAPHAPHSSTVSSE
jgi:hypothetical protein